MVFRFLRVGGEHPLDTFEHALEARCSNVRRIIISSGPRNRSRRSGRRRGAVAPSALWRDRILSVSNPAVARAESSRERRRMAVREGFEPSVELLRPYNGLANRRLQPLGHLTADVKYTARKHLRDCDFLCVTYNGFPNRRLHRIRPKNGADFGVTDVRLWAHSRKDTENPARADGARCAS